MDIEQYLKVEFETYPLTFRNLVRFLASPSVRKEILSAPEAVSCPTCNSIVHWEDVECSTGKRVVLLCSGCERRSGEPQKHKAVAWYQWQSKKGSSPMPLPPLLDEARFFEELKAWVDASSDVNWAHWISVLNWVKKVWSQHKKTKDYDALTETDQTYVDAIGFAIEVLRSHAAVFAREQGFDVTESCNKTLMEKAYGRVVEERLRYYPKYQSRLTPIFRFKLKELLQG